VRELAVVSGGPGRGRESFDVTKDNKGAPQRGKKARGWRRRVDLTSRPWSSWRGSARTSRSAPQEEEREEGKQTEITEMSEHQKVIRIEETITLAELSQTMA